LTDDGGERWRRVEGPTRHALYSVLLRDAESWAVGDAGTILHSADAGEHWSEIPVPEEVKLDWLHAVALAGDRPLVVGAGGLLLRVGAAD
ncbi:MAG: WD40/YVTN/BNR-like repeat-containing protein, partial [Candidatus Binatia bacterium]